MNIRKAAITVLSITLKIVIYAVIVMCVYSLGLMAFDYGRSIFREEALDPMPGRTIEVTVEDGASVQEIAQLLENEGLVEDWKLFFLQVKASKYAKTMEGGTYTLSTAMKPREMMAVMSGEGEETGEETGEEES